jgi:hypothetical protein
MRINAALHAYGGVHDRLQKSTTSAFLGADLVAATLILSD